VTSKRIDEVGGDERGAELFRHERVEKRGGREFATRQQGEGGGPHLVWQLRQGSNRGEGNRAVIVGSERGKGGFA